MLKLQGINRRIVSSSSITLNVNLKIISCFAAYNFGSRQHGRLTFSGSLLLLSRTVPERRVATPITLNVESEVLTMLKNGYCVDNMSSEYSVLLMGNVCTQGTSLLGKWVQERSVGKHEYSPKPPSSPPPRNSSACRMLFTAKNRVDT